MCCFFYCRVVIEKDTKVPCAAIFTVNKEDHTLGNMLRTYVPLTVVLNLTMYSVMFYVLAVLAYFQLGLFGGYSIHCVSIKKTTPLIFGHNFGK